MAWERDVLAAYEHNKARAEAQDRVRTQRTQLIDERHEREWAALREALTNRCIELNACAGRTILEQTDRRALSVRIRREDGHVLHGEYSPKTHTVIFSSETVVYVDDNFEVTVHPVSGADKVVWFHMEKKTYHHAEEISKAVIAKFLRAGFV